MQKLLERRVIRQFIKFGIVGISSAIIDWGLFYFFNRYLAIYYLFAKALSFIFAVINSYIWNRRWTFRSENTQKMQEFSKFLIVSVIGLLLNTLIMFIAVEKYHLRYIFGLMLATAIVVFWNFLANKLWTFRVKNE